MSMNCSILYLPCSWQISQIPNVHLQNHENAYFKLNNNRSYIDESTCHWPNLHILLEQQFNTGNFDAFDISESILVVQISNCIRMGVKQLGIPCPQALLSYKALFAHVATQANTNLCRNMLEQGFIADWSPGQLYQSPVLRGTSSANVAGSITNS